MIYYILNYDIAYATNSVNPLYLTFYRING